MTISVEIEIPVPRQTVWAELERIEDHVAWMRDAKAIRFLDESRRGIGTRFACDTVIGPIRLTDTMEIVEWDEGRRIGVTHIGAVRGTGSFLLSDSGQDRTKIVWEEVLTFPWWLAGRAGAIVARPLFIAIWKGNLRRLAERASMTPGG